MSTPRTISSEPWPSIGMGESLESEGGRKCVTCHRYRRADDLYLRGGHNAGHMYGPGIHVAVTVQPVCGECLRREADKAVAQHQEGALA